MALIVPILLLCVSNIFMTFAWARPDKQKVRWTFCPAERRSGARPSVTRGGEEINA